MSKLKSFLDESKQEFSRINWPTKQETIKMVLIVTAISVFTALFLGAVDYGFLEGIKKLVTF